MNSLKIPIHVAIIPDGNRRWAKSKGLSIISGYAEAGSSGRIREIIEESGRIGVKYLTFWGFSSENWKRDKKEIDFIFSFVSKFLREWGSDAVRNNVKFRHIGRKDRLPKKLVSEIEDLENRTRNCKGLCVQLCLDYGGKDEIIRAVNKIVSSGAKKIDEKIFSNYLDSAGMPEPDLIIRTGGEKRVSGFMPFQSDYAELYFTDIYFPDFDKNEFRKAIDNFAQRERRFGGG